jgi:hypothetical protein
MLKTLVGVLFSLLLLSSIAFAETTLYKAAEKQLLQGNYGDARKLYEEDCSKNGNIASCSMIALAEYPIDQNESIKIAKLWLEYLKKSPDPKIQKFRQQLIRNYIQFYSSQKENVTWLKQLEK